MSEKLDKYRAEKDKNNAKITSTSSEARKALIIPSMTK